MKKFLCLVFALLFMSSIMSVHAQGTGGYAFATFDHPGFDSINTGNLNIRFSVPLVNRPGRGLPFTYALQYEGLIWKNSNGVWVPDPSWGFNGVLNGTGFTGYMTYADYHVTCPGPSGNHGGYDDNFGAFVYHDAFGGVHDFDYSVDTHDCPDDDGGGGTEITGSGSSYDGSGYTLLNMATIQSRDGSIIRPAYSATGSYPTSITDTNGNQVNGIGNGSFTDTLGVTALTISGGSPRTFTYPVTLQANGASTASASLSYRTYTVRTNFQCAVGEYGSTSVSLPDRITLADNSSYSFTYEPTYQAIDGAVTGRLASITLPTGGTIAYTYTGGCNGSGMNDDGTVGALSRFTSDNNTHGSITDTGNAHRFYGRSPVNDHSTATQLTDEKGNETDIVFSVDSGTGAFFEMHRSSFQGPASAGKLLLDRYTCYNGTAVPCDGQAISVPISSDIIVESYNGGSQVTTRNSFDAVGSLTSSSESAQSGPSITTTYNYNSLSEVTSMTESVGGTTFLSTTNGYDESSLTPTSATVPQHNNAAVSGPRGNLTSSNTQGAISTVSYNDTGMPISTTAVGGATTSYGYDPTQTFVTSTSLPVAPLASSASYDPASAALLTSTGLNFDKTTVNSYDSMMRPVDVSLPSESRVSRTFYAPNHYFTYQTLDGSRTAQTETILDEFGRSSRVGTANGQATNGWYQVDYCYDASGLLSFQPTRYQSTGMGTGGTPTSKHCSGSGTSYQHDALGRVTSVTTDDGTATTEYWNRATKTTKAGVQLITQYDYLGRISGVCEVSSKTQNNQSPGDCGMDIAGTGFVTSYSYDLVNHKTTITQGSQTRVFQTDAIGRTTYTSEPERGEASYAYDYNSTGLIVTRTRPRANQGDPNTKTHTSLQYDKLGRLFSTTYDDNLTPWKYLYYDAVPSWLNWQSTPSHIYGRLAATRVAPGGGGYLSGSLYSYGAGGNIAELWQCAPSICGTSAQEGRPALQFGYDLAGSLVYEFDGASGGISYARSLAEEITSVTNQSYTDTPNTPNLVTNVTNGPFGPTNWSLGNNTSVVHSYDGLGRLNGGWLCTGSNAQNAIQYCNGSNTQLYGFLSTYSGSGVSRICDTVLNQCQTNNYDDFNRLKSVTVGGTDTSTYSYDRWGNRTSQTGSPSVSNSFDSTTNRSQNFGYDAAGNQTNDAVHNYTYDAEGNLLLVDGGNTAAYVYDALNHRVQTRNSGGTTEYIYDAFDRRMSSWAVGSSYGAAGAGSEGRIYWDGGLLANRGLNGTTYFHHADWLGTERMRTDYQGHVANVQISRAFGDGSSQSSTDASGAAQDNNQFTSQEQDAESGTVHFQYRQYSPIQGRWMSPDPYSGSYRMRNPQSLNRYSYALNRPLSSTDSLGLESAGCEGGSPGCAGGSGCVYGMGECIGMGGECLTCTVDDNGGVTDHGGWSVDAGDDDCGYSCDGTVVYIPSGSGTVGGVAGGSSSGSRGVGNSPAPNKPTTKTPDLPSCWAVGAQALLNGVTGTIDPTTSVSGAITDLSSGTLTAASVRANIKAELYAASRINTFGGPGLIQANKSSVYRRMKAFAGELGEAADGAILLGLDYNLVSQWKAEANTPCR